MKRLKIIFILILVLLPRLMFSETLTGYEVLLDQAVTLEPSEIRSDYLVGYVSKVIKDNHLNIVYGYGYLNNWVTSTMPSTGSLEGHRKAYITSKASQKLFFTGEGIGNELEVSSNRYDVKDIVNLDSIDPELDVLIDSPSITMDVQKIYINTKGKHVTELDVQQFLYGLNITEYKLNNVSELNDDLYASMVLFEGLLLLLTALWLLKRNQLLDIVAVVVFLLLRVPWVHLPFELLTDQLVSLKYYLDLIVNLPKSIYEFYQWNGFGVFLIKLGFAVIPMYYGMLIIIMKRGIKNEENHGITHGIGLAINSMWSKYCYNRERRSRESC